MATKRTHPATMSDIDDVVDKKSRCCTDIEFPDELVLKTAVCMGLLSDLNCFPFYTLTPLKIHNCNAADSHQGFAFSKAYCSISPIEPLHVFGSVFEKGVYILLRYLDEKQLPENKQEKHLLGKLLNYLLDKDTHALLEKSRMRTETEITVLFANHLFAKLAASPSFIVDCHSKGKEGNDCPCPAPGCKLSGYYGDTSIGNEEVWHGSLDVIINNDLVLEPVEPKPESPGGKSPVEVKLKSESLKSNPQIIAETIVFSFLQKLRHSESDHFLFPCIGVAGKDLVCYFYDSEHDVLLESSPIPLFVSNMDGEEKINFVGILASWLVVNYKYLGSGLTKTMKLQEKRAGFFAQAGSKLQVYESALKFGNVGNPHNAYKNCHVVDTSDPILVGSREIIAKIKAKQSTNAFF